MNNVPSTQIEGCTAIPAVMRMETWRRLVFYALAGFILLSPAPGQLFGQHYLLIREWVMYSGVGVGMPKGEFVLHDMSGGVTRLTPLEAAGLERYPRTSHYLFATRIFEPQDIARFAAARCADLTPQQRLSFEGVVGTRQGWVAMPVENVCAQLEDPA